jgi:hypothetical protein
MIDFISFLDQISPLFDYYGKLESIEGNPRAQAVWYKAVRAGLTDQELDIAIDLCLARHRFLPSPEEFVALIAGTQELEAIAEWQKINSYLASTPLANGRSHVQCQGGVVGRYERPLLSLTNQGELALTAIGGLGRLSELSPKENPAFIQKDFVKFWLGYKSALAIGQVEPPPKKIAPAEPTAKPYNPKSQDYDFNPDAYRAAQERMLEHLCQVNPEFGKKLGDRLREPIPTPEPPNLDTKSFSPVGKHLPKFSPHAHTQA